MANRRIITLGPRFKPGARKRRSRRVDQMRGFVVSAAISKRVDIRAPRHFLNLEQEWRRRPTIRCNADGLPAFIDPRLPIRIGPRRNEGTSIDRDGASRQEPFELKEDRDGRLRLHTKLDGAEIAMGITSLTKARDRSAAAVRPSAKSTAMRRGAALLGATALISAAAAVAVLFFARLQPGPPQADDPRPVDRAVAIAPTPRQREPDPAPRLPAPRAQPPPRGVELASPVLASDDADQTIRRASRTLARPDLQEFETPQGSAAVAAGPDTASVDPYAGRIAKPLTGQAQEAALEADRLATKELNLRQLRQGGAATTVPPGGENGAQSVRDFSRQ